MMGESIVIEDDTLALIIYGILISISVVFREMTLAYLLVGLMALAHLKKHIKGVAEWMRNLFKR